MGAYTHLRRGRFIGFVQVKAWDDDGVRVFSRRVTFGGKIL